MRVNDIFVDPFDHPGGLIVSVLTEDRPEFGVFSGHEHGKTQTRLPTVAYPEWDEGGFETFEIGPLPFPPEHRTHRHHFVVIAHRDRVYVTYPGAHELVVTLNGDDRTGYITYRGLSIAVPEGLWCK